MKKFFFYTKYLFFPLMVSALLVSCNKDLPKGPKANPLNTETFANILEGKLKGKCAGYSFIISYKADAKSIRSGGEARRPQDAPSKPMTFLVDFSIASVSKTITAAAFFKSIQDKRDVTENSLIWTYLPKHWPLGKGIKEITFRQLLTHTSGFRESPTGIGNDYAHLKELVAQGVNQADKVKSYNNRNFSIFRLLIPILAGYDILEIPVGTNPKVIYAFEASQAQQYAVDYIDYCRKNIFSKINLDEAACNYAPDSDPGLYYAFPLNSKKGKIMPDNTLYAGGEGWVLNTAAVSDFFRTLHYTQKILPTAITNKMRDELLGYDRNGMATYGVSYYFKNGKYTFNDLGYHSLIMGFGNDIQVTVMANSIMDLETAVLTAFQEWYK